MIKQKTLNLIFFTLIVILAIAAGLFQAEYQTEQRRYKYLEDKYVRLEMMVGASESAKFIEDSYQIIDNQGQKL